MPKTGFVKENGPCEYAKKVVDVVVDFLGIGPKNR